MFPVVSTMLAIFLLLIGLDLEPEGPQPSLLPVIGAALFLIPAGEVLAWLARKHDSRLSSNRLRLISVFFNLYPIAWFAAAIFWFHFCRLPDRIGIANWVLLDKVVLIAAYLTVSNLSRFYRCRFARALHLMPEASSRTVRIMAFKGELTLLIPFFIFMLFNDLVGLNETVNDYFTLLPILFWAGIILFFFIAALAMPKFIKVLWRMKPLSKSSPVYETLSTFMEAQRFRAQSILVMPTGGRLVNAAILGFTPRSRYIIFTDAMLALLTPLELKSVFAHELGHGRKRHIPLYLLFSFGFVFGLSLLENLIPPAVRLDDGDTLFLYLLGPAALIYWGWVFGFLSRRFEMEADIFGAAAVGSPALFMHTLDRVARVGGTERKRSSWRHFSIARRVASLRKVFFEDPSLAARFWRKMQWVRRGMIALSLALFLVFACDVAVDTLAGFGVIAYRQGDFNTAQADLSRAADFPGGEIHRWTLLKLYLRSDRLSEAASLLEELTAPIDPGKASEPIRLFHIELGLAALDQGEAALSMATWDRGEALFPEDRVFPELKNLTRRYLEGEQAPLMEWIKILNQVLEKKEALRQP